MAPADNSEPINKARNARRLNPKTNRLRYRFVLRLLGDEALKSVQDAEVNLGR